MCKNCAKNKIEILSILSVVDVEKVTCCQFHQHFTQSFYAHKSQKHNKDSQLKQLFALSGTVRVKAAGKHVDEIDPLL